MHLIQVVITFNNYTAENIAVLFTTENEKLNSISISLCIIVTRFCFRHKRSLLIANVYIKTQEERIKVH